MTNTLEELRALEVERLERRAIRRARERANRIGTNLKPHIKEELFRIADEAKLPPRTMVRILIIEAMEARGSNMLSLLKAWKENNPNEAEVEDD